MYKMHFSFLFLAPCVLSQTPSTIGTWIGHTNSLPNELLPDVPLLGNGNVGLLLDSRNSTCPLMGPTNPNTMGWGRNDTTDIYINSNSMWSCGFTNLSVTNNSCGVIAFGGVSISLTNAGLTGPLSYSAWQAIGSGTIGSNWTTVNGGVFSTIHFMHPVDNVIVSELSWAPASGDPAQVNANISTWSNGADGLRAGPYTYSMGCLDLTGAPVNCSTAPPPLLATVSRGATAGNSGSPYQVRAGLATGLVSGQGGSAWHKSTWPFYVYPGVSFIVAVPAHAPPVILLTAQAEASNFSDTDPALTAGQLLLSYLSPQGVQRIGAARDAFWGEFWGRASVSLPQQPLLQALWEGAAYALACAASTNASVPPPALYGPWASTDACGWQGDYTLDYNFESTFFSAFSSNHAPQFASYVTPLLAWKQGGQAHAALMAEKAGITCPAETLNYPCHLAPFGFQSFDRSYYMQWNGLFSLLPIASAWEFTQDLDLAATVFPLFVGHMQWWGCYLVRDSNGVWRDANLNLPDNEHEGQPAIDPMIALVLISRIAAVTVDLGNALHESIPPSTLDIYLHLSPFPTIISNLSNTTSLWVSYKNATVAQSDTFALYPLYPAEALGGIQPLPPGLRTLAQQSVAAYTQGWSTTGRPLDVFVAAILALGGKGAALAQGARTPEDIVTGLKGWLKNSLGRNQLGYAPGGGVENIGVSRAVTELLLGNGVLVPAIDVDREAPSEGGARWFTKLFPAFNASSMGPAAFTGLLAKGGCIYSAALQSGGVVSPVRISSTSSASRTGGTNCTLLDPWAGQGCTVSVACSGTPVSAAWLNTTEGQAVSFLVPPAVGSSCTVTCA